MTYSYAYGECPRGWAVYRIHRHTWGTRRKQLRVFTGRDAQKRARRRCTQLNELKRKKDDNHAHLV